MIFVLAITTGGFSTLNAIDEPSIRLIKEVQLDDGTLQWVSFTPDGKYVAACGDRLIQLTDWKTGKVVRTFRGHKRDIVRLAISPNGKMIAGASHDNTVRVWALETGQLIKEIKVHTKGVIGVNFSADSSLMATTAAKGDSSIRIWDCETWNQVSMATYPENSNAMYVAFSPDGKHLVASGYRGRIRLYRIGNTTMTLMFERKHDKGEMCPHVVFSPNGKSFLTSGWDRTARVWDVSTGDLVWRAPAPDYARCFEASFFLPSGRQTVSVTRGETFVLHDAKTGKKISQIRSANKSIRGFAISPDGKYLATSGHSQSVKIWRLKAGTEKK